jgi:hypothetical protein
MLSPTRAHLNNGKCLLKKVSSLLLHHITASRLNKLDRILMNVKSYFDNDGSYEFSAYKRLSFHNMAFFTTRFSTGIIWHHCFVSIVIFVAFTLHVSKNLTNNDVSSFKTPGDNDDWLKHGNWHDFLQADALDEDFVIITKLHFDGAQKPNGLPNFLNLVLKAAGIAYVYLPHKYVRNSSTIMMTKFTLVISATYLVNMTSNKSAGGYEKAQIVERLLPGMSPTKSGK